MAEQAEGRRAAQQPTGTMEGVHAVVRAGVLSGLLGGVLMAVVATRVALSTGDAGFQPLRYIGAAIIGTDALDGGPDATAAGILVHLVTSIAWAIVFTAVVDIRTRPLAALGLGVAASLLILTIMTFGVLPFLDMPMYGHVMDDLVSWAVAHLAYGVGLSTAPWLRRRARADELAALDVLDVPERSHEDHDAGDDGQRRRGPRAFSPPTG